MKIFRVLICFLSILFSFEWSFAHLSGTGSIDNCLCKMGRICAGFMVGFH